MFKQKRKRKHAVIDTNAAESGSDDLIPPKEKVHIRDVEDEESHILFGDSKSFLKSLEEAAKEPVQAGVTVDSGIESGTSEEDIPERKPAWTDEDDAGIDVRAALKSQSRKLPLGGINSLDNKYSDLLKHKYETIVGTPSWASLHKPKSEPDDDILHSAGFIQKSTATTLPSKLLEFKKIKDLNCETYTEGPYINSVEFHPTSSVGLVAGNKGIATLFAVDGKRNNKLHSVAFEKYPIFCSKFVKGGDEIILGSRHQHIFSYDLIASKALRYKLPTGVTQCKKFVVSPDTQYFAVVGKWGEIHIFSSITKDKLVTLQQNSDVTALEFNAKGNMLFGHSDTGVVTVWDMNMRRVRHKFADEGCLQGTALAASSSNQFLATGSAQGIVNLYNMEDVLKTNNPKPHKTIYNLTTSISDVTFNSSSEMLSLFSSEIKNSVKMYHIRSNSVFSNFPPFESKLGHINCVSFSPGSGFLALGNRKSVVSLFRLKHFKNY
ncbi:hypothetical protein GWI33_014906 [Rhynchophorus ferrugineus]|uniref:U3 small nucleolar RNA-associated protein 18-like protein n=1 Tax=Rhynchophorus ferrugineus TaxID=354439 RepID=A0A834I6G0_RHYFE|nr:hypothetical protein GWI33_014906 [Rhynchophorus ferrugineus]